MLLSILQQMQRTRFEQMYMGDLLWMAVKTACPNIDAPSFGAYCRSFDAVQPADDRSGQEIVNDLAASLRKRIKAREMRNSNDNA